MATDHRGPRRWVALLLLLVVAADIVVANVCPVQIAASRGCQGCRRDYHAGEYIYCTSDYSQNTKTNCDWVGGAGCTFGRVSSQTYASCVSNCANEPGCNWFAYEGGTCNLYLVNRCVQESQGGGMVLYQPATCAPTAAPTTSIPSASPVSSAPTAAPTPAPTRTPTAAPTPSPTRTPSRAPTARPTTSTPTETPTLSPTRDPTSSSPSSSPTTSSPTNRPTWLPTVSPTASPTSSVPTAGPTTSDPTVSPTASPSFSPTAALLITPDCEGEVAGIQQQAENSLNTLYDRESVQLPGFTADCSPEAAFISSTDPGWNATGIQFELDIDGAPQGAYEYCINRFTGAATITSYGLTTSTGWNAGASRRFTATLTAVDDTSNQAAVVARWPVRFEPVRDEFRLKNATHAAEDGRTCGVDQLAQVQAEARRYRARQDLNQTLLLTGINLHGRGVDCVESDLFLGFSNRLDGSPDLTFDVKVYTLDSVLRNAETSTVSLVEATEQVDNVLWNTATGRASILLGDVASYRFVVSAATQRRGDTALIELYHFDIYVHESDLFNQTCGPDGQVIEDAGGVQNDAYDCACNEGYQNRNGYCDPVPKAATSEDTMSDTDTAITFTFGSVVFLLLCYIGYRARQARTRAQLEKIPVDFSERLNQMVEAGLIKIEAAAVDGHTHMKEPKELKRSRIDLLEVVGSGAFGEVRKGIYNPPAASEPEYTVAVKVLKGDPSNDEREELLREAMVTAQFDHKNVVSLVGTVTSGRPLLLVLQFCEGGSLISILRKTKPDPIPIALETLLGYCVGIAAGMGYLSGLHFVHRDLAARNVLVDGRKAPKIADFGLSRDLEYSAYYKGNSEGKMPIRWTAPECIEQNRFGEKSDVWAFGVTMIEIWSRGETPYRGWMNAFVIEQVMSGFRLPIPLECPDQVYFEAIVHCLIADPGRRPDFAMLHTRLIKLLKFKDTLDFTSMDNRTRKMEALQTTEYVEEMYEDFGADGLDTAPENTFSAEANMSNMATGRTSGVTNPVYDRSRRQSAAAVPDGQPAGGAAVPQNDYAEVDDIASHTAMTKAEPGDNIDISMFDEAGKTTKSVPDGAGSSTHVAEDDYELPTLQQSYKPPTSQLIGNRAPEVGSTPPTSNKQPELDVVHPDAAGIAVLPAGEDDTYENHDIEQQRKQSEEKSEYDSLYGVVISGTIRSERNYNDDGNPGANAVANFSQNTSNAADIFTREVDGSVRLRSADQRGEPVALRQISDL